jgi:hypothetical protein
MMPKATYHWKERMALKRTHEERRVQQKRGEKRRNTTITPTSSEEIVDHNAPTYVKKQPDIMDGWYIVEDKILGQLVWCFLQRSTTP